MGALLFPGGLAAPAPSLPTVAELTSDLVPVLGADTAANLEFWDETELLGYYNGGLQRLARKVGLFVVRSTQSVTGTNALYNLPSRHLSTIHVSLGASPLRPCNVRELEALNTTWQADTGTPTRYVQDQGTGAQVRLYKTPTASGTLAIVHHEHPADVTAATEFPASELVMDYLHFYALHEARHKESDAAMLEVAEYAEQIHLLYEQVLAAYFGVAQ